MTRKYTGRCACGAVTFEFDKDPEFIANCHCLDCKKASGGEVATFFSVPEEDFTLIDGVPTAFHYVGDSGKGLDRNFCPTCGARLFTNNLGEFSWLRVCPVGKPRSTRADHAEARRCSPGAGSNGICCSISRNSTACLFDPGAGASTGSNDQAVPVFCMWLRKRRRIGRVRVRGQPGISRWCCDRQ